MDRQAITSRSELEHILFDDSAEPKALPLSLLEHITSGFSDDNEIGDGGFARVYKGILDNGTVAVKKLSGTVDIDDKKFSEEIRCLMKTKHKNIVRFLGYCCDTQGQMMDYRGELVLADVRQRLLCFEYLPQGSLDKQITDASHGLEWRKQYQIINGISDGLYYLHQKRIIHLDLKPTNILLDDNMIPKIADFGLSRCFSEKQSQIITSKLIGTLGYMAPESYSGHITFKSDIYSLGIIIIEILTGEKGYPDIDKVLERWRNRLEKQEDTQLVQVRVCTEIAIECIDSDPAKRPDTQHIIDRLGETRSAVEYATETGASSSSSVAQLAALPPDPTIGPENTMANALKRSTKELYNMENQKQHFSFMLDNTSIVQQVTDRRETASDVEEALIIGRTEEKQKIVATLSGSISPEITILPIYGIGGIGKTTLAQLVFNDSQFSGYSRVWVYVSQNLDLKKIGNSIISQLPKESHVAEKQMIHNESNSIISSKEIHVAEKQMIHNKLRDLLADKKILIVLDDVWEKNPNTLKSLKAMLRLGAGSMVTVIVTTRDEAIAREICHTVGPYKLDTLTNKSCWEIIKQQTAFKDRVDKKQLKHIGKEIAIKCGGVALAAQSLGYTLKGKTSDEWESVRDNYIWNLSTSEDPSSTDHEVLASLLLSYSRMPDWLKLCFSYCGVFPKGRNIAKYDLIHQWIALGFTEPSRIFDTMQLCEKYVTQLLGMSFLQYSKTSSSDTLRDKDVTFFTMHDLMHDLAKEILAHQINTGGNKCRYALLTNCSSALQLFVAFPANITALHFRDCGKQELCGGAFSPAKCLRVLDLSECFIQKLPECIGQLKQLRFLHAPRIQDKMIPNCITELSELNYLNLRGSCDISALPESVGDMKRLMHLDLSGCYGIRELPVSFAELKQLVHLDLSYCNMSEAEALGGCTKLQYLNLSATLYRQKEDIRRLPKIISNLIKLRYLNLSACMYAMMPPLENEIVRLLDSVCNLPNLEHLDLSSNPEYFSIPESIGNLMKLHTLDLLGCLRLKLPADFVVHASIDNCSNKISLLQHTDPEVLTIYRLENVKSAEEARSIKLMQIQTIVELRFEWTVVPGRSVDDKEVLEKLVPPSSVKRLYISGYRSVSVPDWLMGIRQHLPNLSELYLCDFPNCNNLPSLGQLPYLRELGLCRMESLEEWNTAYTSGEPKLEALTIDQCAKLRIKPFPPRAMALRIINCDNMLSSWGESSSHSGSSSSPITKLIVKNSKVPMHQWRLLHQLPALRSLTITGCSDLTTSPKIIQQLSSLVSLSLDQAELPRWLAELTSLPDLRLSECRSMTSLPQWLGKLTFLKELHIMRCEGIRSLPNSIQQLTRLENLVIRGCPTLLEWCELEENKMKLAHIRGIVPRSLMAQEEDTTKIILAAPIHGTTVMDEVHPDVLYSAVMNVPGFAEESLLVALSQLMDNTAQGSAYMAMSEADRVSWIVNYLKRY